MPKRTTVEREEPTGKEIRRPADTTIKVFNFEFDNAKETVDEANDGLKEAAKTAKSKHLHIQSFKVAKMLFEKAKDGEAQAAERLAVWLANFDKYREYFKLDALANLQGRMFGEGEIGAAPAREADEDGEPDMRPDHLRQPGASAAGIVQDLAAKTGAKTSDEDNITKIGRGKTH